MRPEFEFNYEKSINAPGGKSLEEKMRLVKCFMGTPSGSDESVIIIDPERMDSDNGRLERFIEILEETKKKKERKENAE